MNIVAENISFCYTKASGNTLNNVSFNASEGMVTSLIGANGAGKSTMVKILSGVLKAEGRVLIGDRDIHSYSRNELMKIIGYLTQENSFLSSLTVFEVVLLGRMHNLRLRIEDDELERVWNVLSMLGLEELAERPFYALSGGQRRIVGLAQMFVKEPKVMILDEPTANLDIQNELEILELVKRYTKEMGVTTLMILHDLNMASRYSDKLVLLNDGKVYSSGTPIEVITENSIRDAYGVNVHLHVDRLGIPMIHLINSVRVREYGFKKEGLNGFAKQN